MRVNVYVVLAVLCVSSLVAAAEGTKYKRTVDTYEHAVDKCVKEVQKELPNSNFDAYVEAGGTKIKMFGTEESFFKFGKCMDKSGYPFEYGKK